MPADVVTVATTGCLEFYPLPEIQLFVLELRTTPRSDDGRLEAACPMPAAHVLPHFGIRIDICCDRGRMIHALVKLEKARVRAVQDAITTVTAGSVTLKTSMASLLVSEHEPTDPRGPVYSVVVN